MCCQDRHNHRTFRPLRIQHNISVGNTCPRLCSAEHSLGFTHRCATSRAGKFAMHVSTMKKRLRRGLVAIAAWCREHLHTPLESQQQMLNAKLRGHYQYYGRPTNYRSLEKFVHAVRRIWRQWLARRTRGRCLPWPRFTRILARYPLLRPRITHAWRAS